MSLLVNKNKTGGQLGTIGKEKKGIGGLLGNLDSQSLLAFAAALQEQAAPSTTPQGGLRLAAPMLAYKQANEQQKQKQALNQLFKDRGIPTDLPPDVALKLLGDKKQSLSNLQKEHQQFLNTYNLSTNDVDIVEFQQMIASPNFANTKMTEIRNKINLQQTPINENRNILGMFAATGGELGSVAKSGTPTRKVTNNQISSTGGELGETPKNNKKTIAFQSEPDKDGRKFVRYTDGSEEFVNVEGSKAFIEAKDRESADSARIRTTETLARPQIDALTNAINIIDRQGTESNPLARLVPATGAGAFINFLPYTDALELSTQLETIKANIGFDRLATMRERSKTGGALGNISNQEVAFLQATQGNLNQARTGENLRKTLISIEKNAIDRIGVVEKELKNKAEELGITFDEILQKPISELDNDTDALRHVYEVYKKIKTDRDNREKTNLSKEITNLTSDELKGKSIEELKQIQKNLTGGKLGDI
tara:strand:+ start:364 stop:1806 length:1443 start_codon:yes stop_codon:yes gene_type:complete